MTPLKGLGLNDVKEKMRKQQKVKAQRRTLIQQLEKSSGTQSANMRLLLFITLYTMTGFGVSFEVKGCSVVIFTCKYPQGEKEIEEVQLCRQKTPRYRCDFVLNITKSNLWEHNYRFSFFHDATKKHLMVAIRTLQKDSWKYQCRFPPNTTKVLVEVVIDDEDKTCPAPIKSNKIAQTGNKTTITCRYPDGFKNGIKYICKGDHVENCTHIKDQRFSLSSENNVLNVGISKVNQKDKGLYWCGVQVTDNYNYSILIGNYIHLQTYKSSFEKSSDLGHDLDFWCKYGNDIKVRRFICKGEDAFSCHRVLNTTEHDNVTTHVNMTSGRFSMVDDLSNRKITFNISDVRVEDAGTYWCGGEDSEGTPAVFYKRFQLTVKGNPTVALWQTVAIVAVSASLLLLLVVAVTHVCKRVAASKNTKNTAARVNQESLHEYEEIPLRPISTDAGTASPIASVSITATSPTNQCGVLHYSTMAFQHISDEARQGTDADFSAVNVNQSPTYSASSSPPRFEDPLNSTVPSTTNYVVNITVSVKHTPEFS